MNTEFEHLWNRYLQGTASVEELTELQQLKETGDYDHLMTTTVYEKQNEVKTPYPKSIEAFRDQIFERIRPYLQQKQSELDEPTEEQRPTLGRWMKAAAVITLFILAGIYWFRADQLEPSGKMADTGLALRNFIGPDNLHLSDGSDIWLNAGSELQFHESFGKEKREIFLTGEAFFNVSHDPSKPFVVHTGKINTTVLGTAFNVRAFPGEEIKVTVERGLVQVAGRNRIYGKLRPDEQMTVRPEAGEFVAHKTEASKATAWKDQLLILKDVTMQEAVKLIGEKFNVTVTISNPALSNCQVNTFFLREHGLEKILSVLTEITNATYKIDGKIAIIEGGGCE